MELSQVIKKPLLTEKTMALTAEGKFTFAVDKRVNKRTVRRAIEEFFKVTVKQVWLFKVKGKKRRVGRLRRKTITGPDWKKAIVKLAKDQKIDLFEIEAK